jgi:exo-1,4-beta-D-glucosaminidase
MSFRLRILLVALFLLGMAGLTAATPQPSAAALSVGMSTIGSGGWEVQSSATATQSGSAISTPGFSTTGWMNVSSDDAGAPGTELEALVQSGACPNVFFSTNMKTCFGYMSKIGSETISQFKVPWWWRTDFTGGLASGQDATLVVNGVVGQADVWLNGAELATQSTVQGAYTRYTFDITSQMLSGDNALAIEVYPNDPTSMLTLDNVDWTQIPPDNMTGIQFPIQLHISNPLGLSNVHVIENNAANMSSSALTVKADVTNHGTSSQTGTVSASITAPGGSSPLTTVTQTVTVPGNTTQTVSFAPASYPTLTLTSPQVWWPYQMGGQPLYTLGATLTEGSLSPETVSETFGIRTVTSALVGASSMAPNGVRQFSINGRPFIFRGGGWSESLLLHYSSQDTANQIALMKAMGVNGIRTEGKQLPDDFYEQMDKAGLLIDAGFQCCDFWESTNYTTAQLNVYQNSALTIGQNLRNHPSVLDFSWSDNAPTTQQETAAINGLEQADFYPEQPLISSAEYKTDPQGTLGSSGEKEGPYDWVPPVYWYDTSHTNSDSTLTNDGGSWGFDSEESAGDTVPTMDSINRWLSASDQSNLWQSTKYNQYHLNYETQTSGYNFGTFYNFDTGLKARYGTWSSLAQYVQEGQVQNYESTRAQFEAFIDHWNNTSAPSTGTVYWMMNKGWPSMLWTLYNYDYDASGSYFGAETANRTIHALYALDTGTVTLDNLSGATQSGLVVTAKVYDINGNVLDTKSSGSQSLTSQQVLNNVLTPTVPTGSPVQTYFVELTLTQNGTTIDRNVYWLSTQPDVVNWKQTLGKPQGAESTYANLTALQSLPTGSISVTASTPTAGTTNVTITNTSASKTVAFFLRADVRRGTSSGTELSGDNQVLPITWSDNDITLFPGESQTITATYASSLLQGATPVVSIQGWNIPKSDVLAGENRRERGRSRGTAPSESPPGAGMTVRAAIN